MYATQPDALCQHLHALSAKTLQNFDLRNAFTEDPARFDSLTVRAPDVSADLSKQLWGTEIVSSLQALADASKLALWRQRLLDGEVVNLTEQRPADHARWRMACLDTLPDAMQNMLALAEKVRSCANIRHVVHIGIGGSGLGPDLALQALLPFHTSKQAIRIVSNLDGHDLQEKLQGLQPESTLFIVVSKSWSTHETLRNTASAMQWFREQGGTDISQHFVAVTSKPDKAAASGIHTVLPMSEGMGGRFSIWSAVGLPLAIALGTEHFLDFIRGGAAMDQHFAEQPWASNMHGQPLPYHTAGLTWGEEGSNGQHAFFQWLHQGTCRMSTEFIVVKQPTHDFDGHHESLMANALAQSRALMIGSKASGDQLPGHQDFPGNRPSTTLVLDALTPASLGALLALYEHRVFVAGVIWGINSFDQWGVELGKSLAKDLTPRFQTGDTTGLDASTAGLLGWLRGK